MQKRKFLFIAVLLVGVFKDGHALTIDEPIVDFGEQYQFTEVARDVRIWNESTSPVRITAPAPTAGSAKLKFDTELIEAKSSTLAHVDLSLADRIGSLTARFPFTVDSAGKNEQREIILTGYVDSILDDPKPGLDFGVVEAKLPTEKSITISSTDEPQVRMTSVLEKSNFLSVRLDDDGHTLHIAPAKLNVLGFNKGVVKVALDSKRQKEAWVTVLMDIHGDVVPDQNPLDFGVQRGGSRHPVRLQLSSRSDQPFRVGEIKVESPHVSIEATKCLKPSKSCSAYLLKVDADHGLGEIVGKTSFDLPDSHQTLNVHFGGIFLKDKTPLIPLDKSESDKSVSKSDAYSTPDVAESLKKAVSQDKDSAPAGSGPLLKWQVANESGIYGYAIYRGNSVDGTFIRANEQIVKAENGGDNTTANYQWRDTTAIKGREYWYYVTIFNNDGKKTQLTGPQKVVAK